MQPRTRNPHLNRKPERFEVKHALVHFSDPAGHVDSGAGGHVPNWGLVVVVVGGCRNRADRSARHRKTGTTLASSSNYRSLLLLRASESHSVGPWSDRQTAGQDRFRPAVYFFREVEGAFS